jgi:AraC family transcriptional regulator
MLDFYRTTYPQGLVEPRCAGGLGASLFEVSQGPGDWSDDANSDLVVFLNTGPNIDRQRVNLGAGPLPPSLRAGEFAVTPPASATEIEVDDPQHLLVLCLPWQRVMERTVVSGLPVNGDFGRLHAQTHRDPEVPRLMLRLWAAMRGPHASSALLADSIVLHILSRFSASAERQRHAIGGLAPWQVRLAQRLIRDRLADPITLAELGDAVGLSAFHFCRAFHQSVGVSPHRAQILARMERACGLLEASTKTITEIALECSYQSSQAFSRVFRKEIGATPLVYRRDAARVRNGGQWT